MIPDEGFSGCWLHSLGCFAPGCRRHHALVPLTLRTCFVVVKHDHVIWVPPDAVVGFVKAEGVDSRYTPREQAVVQQVDQDLGGHDQQLVAVAPQLTPPPAQRTTRARGCGACLSQDGVSWRPFTDASASRLAHNHPVSPPVTLLLPISRVSLPCLGVCPDVGTYAHPRQLAQPVFQDPCLLLDQRNFGG